MLLSANLFTQLNLEEIIPNNTDPNYMYKTRGSGACNNYLNEAEMLFFRHDFLSVRQT